MLLSSLPDAEMSQKRALVQGTCLETLHWPRRPGMRCKVGRFLMAALGLALLIPVLASGQEIGGVDGLMGIQSPNLTGSSPESCTPLTPMWAAQLQELAGVAPLRACQCEGHGYNLTLVEFADSTECESAEMALRENLGGEAIGVEGEEGFWKVYWIAADELGLLCNETMLYMITAPQINADVIAAIMGDPSSLRCQTVSSFSQLNLSTEDLEAALEPSDRSGTADLWSLPLAGKELTSSEWQLGRGDGSVIGILRLLPDGSIGGYTHPNESRWQVQDGAIVFYHQDGRESTRFDAFRKDQGLWVISGPFLLQGGVAHILRQLPALSSTD
jgi:hypothetical protein